MNLKMYLEQKKRMKLNEISPRLFCLHCRQPKSNCYCELLKPFDSKCSFVILMHPLEAKKSIASGRMAHLILKDSELIIGENFSNDFRVNELLKEAGIESFILYPGIDSRNLSSMSTVEKKDVFQSEKKCRIFLIDGTWATAKKMMRISQNLKTIPKISFVPNKNSSFRVRKQPKDYCFSTLEAIHETIELIGEIKGFQVKERGHDHLLEVFNHFVEKQLSYSNPAHYKD